MKYEHKLEKEMILSMETNYKNGKALRMGQKINVLDHNNLEFLTYLDNNVVQGVDTDELKAVPEGNVIPLFDGKRIIVKDLDLVEQKGNYFLKGKTPNDLIVSLKIIKN